MKDYVFSNDLPFKTPPKLAIVSPSRNFPTGFRLSLKRRIALINWARKNNCWLLEDDYDSTFWFNDPPLTALQGMSGSERIIYAGSFSRAIHPDIRLGYLILPPALVEPFHKACQLISGGVSQLAQHTLAGFMASGDFYTHIRKMTVLYRQRKTFLHSYIDEKLGNYLLPLGTEGGMHSVFALSEGMNDQLLCNQATNLDLGIKPLSSCYYQLPSTQGTHHRVFRQQRRRNN